METGKRRRDIMLLNEKQEEERPNTKNNCLYIYLLIIFLFWQHCQILSCYSSRFKLRSENRSRLLHFFLHFFPSFSQRSKHFFFFSWLLGWFLLHSFLHFSRLVSHFFLQLASAVITNTAITRTTANALVYKKKKLI